MPRKELFIESFPETPDENFIRYFQKQILLLLTKNGTLTDRQYKSAQRLIGENK